MKFEESLILLNFFSKRIGIKLRYKLYIRKIEMLKINTSFEFVLITSLVKMLLAVLSDILFNF